MRDVNGVVDAGADADDVAHGREGVDGHAQAEVAEAHHVHQGEQDAGLEENSIWYRNCLKSPKIA